jgi:PKD repeat protein
MKIIILFIAVFFYSLNVFSQLTYNNWLNIPNYGSYVTVGDVDVTGNQITVEANFNSTSLSSSGSWGHLVAKHTGAYNINYAISPNGVEIATLNDGYKSAAQTCIVELNKNYHIALVYNGSSLKFYRNGFLISETPCSGNLVTNNLQTTIGQQADFTSTGDQFRGYTNEIRIWNVARTQAQIRQYMNSSLPTPTTQTGLLAYYTFDNLLNKQGNALFDAKVYGEAKIKKTNPKNDFVADSCGIKKEDKINNWVQIPSYRSYVKIGDLDVTGNQITVEALFNAKHSYANLGYSSSVVSKHSTDKDCNYSLRVHAGEITTTDGYFTAGNADCDYEVNKTYHVALVYNGRSLIFYRNGFKLAETKATGNLINNDFLTVIGDYAHGSANESLPGYTNQVRIWNIARTQEQIKEYMNKDLLTPTQQKGLLAYYTFDYLKNKQGSAKFDAKVFGDAKIQKANPVNEFIADSCGAEKKQSSIDFQYTIANCNNVLFRITNSKNIKSFSFDLGDKNSNSQQTFTHTYDHYGTFTVVLTALGTNGKTIKVQKNITILNEKANFSFELNNNSMQALFISTNNATSLCNWQFGDGTTATGNNVTNHQYNDYGFYNATLIITSPNGYVDSVSKTIVLQKPVPKDTILYVNSASFGLSDAFAGYQN